MAKNAASKSENQPAGCPATLSLQTVAQAVAIPLMFCLLTKSALFNFTPNTTPPMPTLKTYKHAHTLTLPSYPGYRPPLGEQKRHALRCILALVAVAVVIVIL
jgi:hypothetical protein